MMKLITLFLTLVVGFTNARANKVDLTTTIEWIKGRVNERSTVVELNTYHSRFYEFRTIDKNLCNFNLLEAYRNIDDRRINYNVQYDRLSFNDIIDSFVDKKGNLVVLTPYIKIVLDDDKRKMDIEVNDIDPFLVLRFGDNVIAERVKNAFSHAKMLCQMDNRRDIDQSSENIGELVSDLEGEFSIHSILNYSDIYRNRRVEIQSYLENTQVDINSFSCDLSFSQRNFGKERTFFVDMRKVKFLEGSSKNFILVSKDNGAIEMQDDLGNYHQISVFSLVRSERNLEKIKYVFSNLREYCSNLDNEPF